jgi:transposase
LPAPKSTFLEKRVGGDSLGSRMLIPFLRLSREDGMGKPYSMDLRERVVAASEGGESMRQAAARFSIGIATAGTWARLKRATGDVRPAKQGKPKGSVLDVHAISFWTRLQRRLTRRLREERGVTVVRTAVWKFLDRYGQKYPEARCRGRQRGGYSRKGCRKRSGDRELVDRRSRD